MAAIHLDTLALVDPIVGCDVLPGAALSSVSQGLQALDHEFVIRLRNRKTRKRATEAGARRKGKVRASEDSTRLGSPWRS